MKIVVMLGLALMAVGLTQAQTSVTQQAGDCSVSVAGNGNSASLSCSGLDPKIAEEVKAILNSSRRSERASKDISQKLDLILKEIEKGAIHIEQHSEGANSPNTVNINQLPPPRRVPTEKKDEIAAILARRPGRVRVSAVINNAEAYQFAQDWYDLLKAARWTMMDDVVRIIEVIGKPEPGLFLRVHGDTVPPGGMVVIPKDGPGGVVAEGLAALGIDLKHQLQRFPDMPEDEVSFEVHEQLQQ